MDRTSSPVPACPPPAAPPQTQQALLLVEHALSCPDGDAELCTLEDAGWVLSELAFAGCGRDPDRAGFWAVLSACLVLSAGVDGIDDGDLPEGFLAGIDAALSAAHRGDVAGASDGLSAVLGAAAPLLDETAFIAARNALTHAT